MYLKLYIFPTLQGICLAGFFIFCCSELVVLSGYQEAHANVWSCLLKEHCFWLSLPNWLGRQYQGVGEEWLEIYVSQLAKSELVNCSFFDFRRKIIYVRSYKINPSIYCHVVLHDLYFKICLLPPYASFSINFIYLNVCVCIYIYIYIYVYISIFI